MKKSTLTWLARLVVSGLVLALLFRIVPAAELWAAMRQLSPLLWLGSVALFLGGHVVAAYKWRLLMGRRNDVPARLWLTGHFAGLTANLALPGVAGGDLVRAGWVMTKVERRESVAVASLVDRFIDLVALLCVAFVGLLWAGQAAEAGTTALMVAAGLILTGAVGAAGLYLYLRGRELTGMVGRLVDALTSLRHSWLPLGALMLSLIVQTTFVAINVQLGEALGLTPGFGAWMMAWPLAKLVATLPISLAGLGVREAALAAFMRPFAVSSGAVIAVGLLWETILVAGGLIGWTITTFVTAPNQESRAAAASAANADESRRREPGA